MGIISISVRSVPIQYRRQLGLLTEGENTAPSGHTCPGTSRSRGSICQPDPMRTLLHPISWGEAIETLAAAVQLGGRPERRLLKRERWWRGVAGGRTRMARVSRALLQAGCAPALSMPLGWPLWTLVVAGRGGGRGRCCCCVVAGSSIEITNGPAVIGWRFVNFYVNDRWRHKSNNVFGESRNYV